jgi:DNA-binding transcriptional LysR family regulator
MEKYRVTLTADERNALEKLVSVGRAAARKLTHARMLLLADTSHRLEQRDDQIVLALGTSLRSVERVRKRFVTEGIDTAIHPKPQPPRPDKITIKGEIEQQLVQLACSDPPQGRCHWTLQLLADELVVLGLVDTISTETVRQALKKTRCSHGSSKRGVSHRMPMPTSSGAWKMSSKRTNGPMIRVILWSVSTKPANNCRSIYSSL